MPIVYKNTPETGRQIGDLGNGIPSDGESFTLKDITIEDKDVDTSVNSIIQTLQRARNVDGLCIMEYKNNDLKMYKVSLTNADEEERVVVIKLDKLVITSKVPNVQVCVVTGGIYGTNITVKKKEVKVLAKTDRLL